MRSVFIARPCAAPVTPNVHNEGRAACGASLSIVGLAGKSLLPKREYATRKVKHTNFGT